MTALYGYPCHFVKFEERNNKRKEEVELVMTDVTKEQIEKLNEDEYRKCQNLDEFEAHL